MAGLLKTIKDGFSNVMNPYEAKLKKMSDDELFDQLANVVINQFSASSHYIGVPAKETIYFVLNKVASDPQAHPKLLSILEAVAAQVPRNMMDNVYSLTGAVRPIVAERAAELNINPYAKPLNDNMKLNA